MPILLVTGPANAGKAQVVMDSVRRHLAQGREPLLVVPTRADVESYLRELAGEEAILGARVERFAGLTAEIVRRAGIRSPVLGGLARTRTIHRLVSERAGTAPAAGFVEALGELFAELQVRGVRPGRLTQAIGSWSAGAGAPASAGQLAELYRDYRRTLERLGRMDAEQRVVRALDALREHPAAWGGTPVLFYGFDDMTRLQFDAIETLGRVIDAEVLVSLAYEPARTAFAGRATTFQDLAPLASEHRELLARPDYYAPSSRAVLSHVERSLFEPGVDTIDPGGAVRLLEGGGERAELELVAEEIAALIADGVEPEEIAILARVPGTSMELLAEVLAAAAIPFAMQRRRRFGDTALGRGLLGLLRSVGGGENDPEGRLSDLLAWLRAPGLLERPELADRLELEARRSGVASASGARALWQARNWPLETIDQIAEAGRRGPLALLDRVARELDWLFSAPRRAAASVLTDEEVEEARTLSVGRRALAELRELARLAPQLAPRDALELACSLDDLEIYGGEQPRPGAVAVLDPLALRARRVRALFVCGMQEGSFPARARAQPLLGEDERRALAESSGLVLGEPQDTLAAERYLLYASLSRPRELLVLSWHVADDDGQPTSRSLFVDDVCDLFTDALSEQRARRPLGAVDGLPAQSPPRAREQGASTLTDEELLEGLRARVWSASSLEAWIGCPVRWYVERLLKPGALDPDPEPLAQGGLAHEALKDTLQGLRERTGSARVSAASLPLAKSLLAAALPAREPEFRLSVTPERRAAVMRRLESDLERYLEHLSTQPGRLEPRELELGFGFAPGDERGEASTLAPFELGGGMRMLGRIDRVDVDERGQAVVIDYKSSQAPPAAKWLTKPSIQVALYMLAVEQLLELPVVAGLYQPLSGEDLRARGVIDGDSGVEIESVSTDVREHEQVRELLEQAAAAAREVAAQASGGELQPRPQSCAYKGGCVPEHLPVRAMSASPQGVSETLTSEQEQAIGRRAEPLLLAAAAGSGKTSVLVERFVRAVREDGLAPARILAITFTERAAGELRARVRARLLELGDREAARDTEAAFVGTFHGFCARVLRAHPLAGGLDPDFDILEEGVAGALRAGAFKAALRDFLAEGGTEAVELLAAYKVDRVHAIVEQAHAELRSRGQRMPRLPIPRAGDRDDCDSLDAVRACILLDGLLVRFAEAYDALKAARGAVDFDDLELRAYELLATHAGVRAAWSERFELLMVDEFQDTNPRQLAILHALERGNLFTVGDELQSIYGFRHADVSLFRARREELQLGGRSLELTRNFRGRPPLLELVNGVFAERFEGYSPLYAGRAESITEEGAEVELLLTCTEGWEEAGELSGQIADGLPGTQPWRAAEARMLAQRVAELVDGGAVRAGEVVVLLRATGDLEVFERALQLAGLQTLAAVGAFWGHQQVGDLIAYLRALANPYDEQALYSVLASPLAGCSRDALALLAGASREARRGAWETALEVAIGRGEGLTARLSPSDREALGSFCLRLQRERAGAARWTLSELIERGAQAGGYREHVLGLDWGERRLANVQKLLRLARRFEAGEGRDLRAFLDHVERLQASAQLEPDAPVEGVEPDAVRLMSIHAAKGLEFPVVCVADLGRAPNTQTPDLLVDGERVGLRLVRLDGGKSLPTLDYEELAEERRRREAQEEERVLYVAMTRARERLLLSGSAAFARWPQSTRAPTPISWLAPAIAGELPERASAGESLCELSLPNGVRVRCSFNTPANLGTVLRAPVRPESSAPAAGPLSGERAGARVGSAGGSLPRAGAPGAREETLSYTALSELERCGYRYYLERVLGLGEDRAAARGGEAGSGLEARARGTLVHLLMESIDFARPAAPTEEHIVQAAGELGVSVGASERAEIADLIGRACREALVGRVADATSIRREHPFAFTLGAHEPLITGFIDLLARERDGTWLVLDYKSDRVAVDTDLAGQVEREYSIQRLLYALAALRGGAQGVEIVHWFLERPREPVSARFEAAEAASLEAQLRSRTDLLSTRPFQVSASPHRGLCLGCPGRVGLCSWGETETLREDPEQRTGASQEPCPAANAGDSADPGVQLGLF